MSLFRRERLRLPARVSVASTGEDVYAHVEIDCAMNPGDRVCLDGEMVRIAFGEQARFTRTATVDRAPAPVRAWTRFAGHFGLTHLYEVSFSGRHRV